MYLQQFREAINRTANKNLATQHLAIETEKQLFERNRFIKQVDDAINYRLQNNFPKEEIAEIWNEHKEAYKRIRSKLNVHYRNLHKFDQATTENIMDYPDYSENDIVVRTNPFKKRSFWKFQWKALQDDVKKFYKSE